MIAVKSSKFSPRRVNKHHSAGSAMPVLMCKDPTGLFDTLLRFSSPSFCPLYPCTSMSLWPFGLWALTPELGGSLKGACKPQQQCGNIWHPDLSTPLPCPCISPRNSCQSRSFLLCSKLICKQYFNCFLPPLPTQSHRHKITNP